MAFNKSSIIITVIITAVISVLATALYYEPKINDLEKKISGFAEKVITDEMQSADFDGFEDLKTGYKERPDKTIEIPSENIAFDFEGTQGPVGGPVISFGPLGIAPESPTEEPFYESYYSLRLVDQRDFDKIISSLSDQEPVTIEPSQENVKGYNVVTWAVGNFCESRFFEIIGQNKNIHLYSNGCHTDNAQTDFDYFKKSIIAPE